MKVIRLKPGQEIRSELESLSLKAGAIITCVGSLKSAKLRMADSSTIRELQEELEIVSLVGTLSPDGCHIHISLADKEGNVIGGHLKEGIVYTTAEIVLAELDTVFFRKLDPETGYKELFIE